MNCGQQFHLQEFCHSCWSQTQRCVPRVAVLVSELQNVQVNLQTLTARMIPCKRSQGTAGIWKGSLISTLGWIGERKSKEEPWLIWWLILDMRKGKQSATGCVNMSHTVLDFHLFSSRSVSISSELFPTDLSVPKEGMKPLWTELSCKIRHVPTIDWALFSALCSLPQKLTSLYECEHSQACGILQRENWKCSTPTSGIVQKRRSRATDVLLRGEFNSICFNWSCTSELQNVSSSPGLREIPQCALVIWAIAFYIFLILNSFV